MNTYMFSYVLKSVEDIICVVKTPVQLAGSGTAMAGDPCLLFSGVSPKAVLWSSHHRFDERQLKKTTHALIFRNACLTAHMSV